MAFTSYPACWLGHPNWRTLQLGGIGEAVQKERSMVILVHVCTSILYRSCRFAAKWYRDNVNNNNDTRHFLHGLF